MVLDRISSLTEPDVLRLIRAHVEGCFPKTCSNCQKVYPTYREYLLSTERVGVPMSYDIEMGNWWPASSHGNIAFANCSCGNTLAITSQGMPLGQIWQILHWVKTEAKLRDVKTQDVICYIRDVVEGKAVL